MTDPSQINNSLDQQLPTNNSGKITAAVLRGALTTGVAGSLGLTAWIVATFAGLTSPNTFTGANIFASSGSVTVQGPFTATGSVTLPAGAAATNVGTLSGDLTGTLPSPTIAAGAVTGAKMSAGSAATNLGGGTAQTGVLYGNGTSAATAITPGSGVATALAQPVTGTGSIVLSTNPTFSGSTNLPTTFPSSFGTTPTSLSSVNAGSYPTSAMSPAGILQGITSSMVVPTTYTQTPWPNTPFAAYCDNQNTAEGGSCVDYFGVALADGSAGSWIFNGVVSNTAPAHWVNGTGLGNNFQVLVGIELDANIYKVGTAAPTGELDYIRIVSGSEVNPVGNAIGMRILNITGVPALTWGIKLDAGATVIGVDLGELATGANQNSQPIYFRSTNASSTEFVDSIVSDTAGNLDISAHASVSLYNNGNIVFQQVGGYTYVDGPDGTGRFLAGSSGIVNRFRDTTGTNFENDTGSTVYALVNSNGVALSSGEAFSINGVSGVTKTCTVPPTVVGGIITSC